MIERKEKGDSPRPFIDQPFILGQSSPTCSNCQPSRGMPLTPSIRLRIYDPALEEEDRLIGGSLLVFPLSSPLPPGPPNACIHPLTFVPDPP
jgi:hypothetical protein